jgi:hypothetical protein
MNNYMYYFLNYMLENYKELFPLWFLEAPPVLKKPDLEGGFIDWRPVQKRTKFWMFWDFWKNKPPWTQTAIDVAIYTSYRTLRCTGTKKEPGDTRMLRPYNFNQCWTKLIRNARAVEDIEPYLNDSNEARATWVYIDLTLAPQVRF